jgi:hypothetical protein
VLADFQSEESAEDRRLALEEADRIIKDFEDLGLIVLICAPEPVIKVPLFRCADWFNNINPIASPGTTISREFLEEIRRPVMDSIAVLRERHPRLRVWDPLAVLCTSKEFSAYDENGLPLFYDGDHFSGHANRLLAPSFIEHVSGLWKQAGPKGD